jgi:Uma2 family endonuclease
MATLPIEEPHVTVEEYLRTAYRPDCDYVDGRVEERNVGEYDHGLLQLLLGHLFLANRDAWGVRAVTDVRLQVSQYRFRVPDVMVLRASAPREQIVTHPPLIAIEILSPEDRLSRMQERIRDYRTMGVEHMWVIDPATRTAWVADASGSLLVQPEVLAVAGTEIRVDLAAVFAEMERG